jgi:hypothetical protein
MYTLSALAFSCILLSSCSKQSVLSNETDSKELKPSQAAIELSKKLQKAIDNDTRVLSFKAEKEKNRLLQNSAFQEQFFTESINEHCNTLLSLDPQHVFNDGFVWQSPTMPSMFFEPDAISGDPAFMNTPETKHLESLDVRLRQIESQAVNSEADVNAQITQMEGALDAEISSVIADPSMDMLSKQESIDALFGTRQMLRSEANYLQTLMSVTDPDNGQNIIELQQRKRSFLGKLVRAVARVAIAVVAVTVVTALVVKTGGLASVKFAAAIKKTGSFWNGVLYGVKVKSGVGTYSSLVLGGVYGAINATTKWEKDMSIEKWYNEFKITIKPKLP